MRKPRELQHLKSSRTTVGRGIPRNDEGSDGDLALRITNTGLKLFAKYQNKWYIVGEYMKEAVLDEKRQPRHLPFTPGSGGFFNNQGGISVPKGALLDFGGNSKSNTLGVNVNSSITNETSNALLTVDSLNLLSAHAVGSGSFVRVPHTAGAFECKKIYITDSYGNVLGDTHIASNSADELTITVGGQAMLHFIESTTNTMESAEIAEYLIRSGTSGDPVLHLKNETNDATSAKLKFTNERSGGGNVGVNNDRAGIIEFWTEDDAGNSTNVATITSSISDVTDGSEDGLLLFEALGGTTSEIKLDSGGTVKLDAGNANDTFGVQFALNGTTVGDITGHHAKTYFTLYENIGGGTDKFYIACEANGATEIATLDGAGAAADLSIVPDGSLSLEPSGSLTLRSSIHQLEQASADADQAGFGQLWIKNATPNELYFTNDAGNDIQITSGSSTAGGGYWIQTWSSRFYTRYDNWFYGSSIYGPNNHQWSTNRASSTLESTWFDSWNPGIVVPKDCTLTEYSYTGSFTSAQTYQVALIKIAKPTYGSDTTLNMTQMGSTQEVVATANNQYSLGETGLSVSLEKGDMILPALRRTTTDTSTYYYFYQSFSIVCEVS